MADDVLAYLSVPGHGQLLPLYARPWHPVAGRGCLLGGCGLATVGCGLVTGYVLLMIDVSHVVIIILLFMTFGIDFFRLHL